MKNRHESATKWIEENAPHLDLDHTYRILCAVSSRWNTLNNIVNNKIKERLLEKTI